MATLVTGENAFGAPGIAPRWTHGNKDGVGTAYAASSRVWYTLWNGILTEVYYPTADSPQIRDLILLVTDGKTFCHDEKHDMQTRIERRAKSLEYQITNADPHGRYRIVKTIISDPHLPVILQRVRVEGDVDFVKQLKLYVLCAPHLKTGGWHNNAHVAEVSGYRILVAEKEGRWLALGASVPFTRLSCGYVGRSDGWTDLKENFQMDWQFAQARDGNVALTGEIDLSDTKEFTLALAFGGTLNHAITALIQNAATPFEDQRARFQLQWERTAETRLPLEEQSGDGGRLYCASYSLLLAHEDKAYPGAFVASLAVPWGEARGDAETGGYHLVWVRDMFLSASGLLAAGNTESPLRALMYMAAVQRPDGGFAQNFTLDGEPHWNAAQLDQVAFPIILAYLLKRAGALRDFRPYGLALRGLTYLIMNGPATQQERWEEDSGYSPSTLGACIAALICGAALLRERGDGDTAEFVEQYADFLESHLDEWLVTNAGSLLPGVNRHYIRITPGAKGQAPPEHGPDGLLVTLTSQPPGTPEAYPASEIIDAGFLELTRFGLRRPDDPLIVNSLKVVDAVLKVDTPFGPCWKRYNHDGYGQKPDGGAYERWGQGRPWPLLTTERGLYEMAAGNAISVYIKTMEGFASPAGMLPEQIWDAPDLPNAYLTTGKSTGSAMPLMWPHAGYIKLLRAAHDGQAPDRIPEVWDRYAAGAKPDNPRQVWTFACPVTTLKPGQTLRVIADAPFRLRWSDDGWETCPDADSVQTILSLDYADVAPRTGASSVRFTFFWKNVNRWGRPRLFRDAERLRSPEPSPQPAMGGGEGSCWRKTLCVEDSPRLCHALFGRTPMEQTIEQQVNSKTPVDQAQVEALLTEALREFALIRERIEKNNLVIEQSQIRTRLLIDQLNAELSKF